MESSVTFPKAIFLIAMLIVYSGNGDNIKRYMEDEEETDIYMDGDVAHGRTPNTIFCGLKFIKTPVFGKDRLNEDDDVYTDEDKILGGSYAVYGEIPWIVSLFWTQYYVCAGSIINEYWILTPAHCVYYDSHESFTVKVGDRVLSQRDADENTFKISKIIWHPKALLSLFKYDMALLKIKATSDGRGIQFNKHTQPVCLPAAGDVPKAGTRLLVAGWGNNAIYGYMPSDVLKKILLRVLSMEDCQKTYDIQLQPNMFCVGHSQQGNQLCGSDVGGPAVHETGGYSTLYGVVTWGFACHGEHAPDFISNVTAYREWIDETIQKHSRGSEGYLPLPPVKT